MTKDKLAIRYRITPARAGKTHPIRLPGRGCGDHPRSCGKDLAIARAKSSHLESPPLVRERPPDGPREDRRDGITPARAGKTCPSTCTPAWKGDHPRSCGKDSSSKNAGKIITGSPPLVRERQIWLFFKKVTIGITPARAGKTKSASSANYRRWDHPRSCGKDKISVFRFPHNSGSPPLVRERRRQDIPNFQPSGITPARAGKTSAAGR